MLLRLRSISFFVETILSSVINLFERFIFTTRNQRLLVFLFA